MGGSPHQLGVPAGDVRMKSCSTGRFPGWLNWCMATPGSNVITFPTSICPFLNKCQTYLLWPDNILQDYKKGENWRGPNKGKPEFYKFQ